MVSPIYISSLNLNFVLFAVHLNVALQVIIIIIIFFISSTSEEHTMF